MSNLKQRSVAAALAAAVVAGAVTDRFPSLSPTKVEASSYLPMPFLEFRTTPEEVRKVAASNGLSTQDAAKKLLFDFIREKFTLPPPKDDIEVQWQERDKRSRPLEAVVVFSYARTANRMQMPIYGNGFVPFVYIDKGLWPDGDDPALDYFDDKIAIIVKRDDPVPVVVPLDEARATVYRYVKPSFREIVPHIADIEAASLKKNVPVAKAAADILDEKIQSFMDTGFKQPVVKVFASWEEADQIWNVLHKTANIWRDSGVLGRDPWLPPTMVVCVDVPKEDANHPAYAGFAGSRGRIEVSTGGHDRVSISLERALKYPDVLIKMAADKFDAMHPRSSDEIKFFGPRELAKAAPIPPLPATSAFKQASDPVQVVAPDAQPRGFHEYQLTLPAVEDAAFQQENRGRWANDYSKGIHALLDAFVREKFGSDAKEPLFVFGNKEDGARLARILNNDPSASLIPVIAVNVNSDDYDHNYLREYKEYRGTLILRTKDGGMTYPDLDDALGGTDEDVRKYVKETYDWANSVKVIIQEKDGVTVKPDGTISVEPNATPPKPRPQP